MKGLTRLSQGASGILNRHIGNSSFVKSLRINLGISFSNSLSTSAISQQSQSEPVLNLPRVPVTFRTPKTDPVIFDVEDIGLFHTINYDKYKQLFQYGPEERFQNQVKTVMEAAFMVRSPFLEIRDCLTNTDMSQPIRRYLLYGKRGAGKTMTLNSLIHYGSSAGYMLVQVPFPLSWLHLMTPEKTEISNWNQRRIDLPFIGADWLRNFKVQNAVLLATRKDLVTTKTYKWTERESTPEGSHLNALIEFGLERIRYSCDCIGAILRELRLFSQQENRKPLKTLVTVDGVNMFWMQTTLARPDQSPKVFVPAETVSLVHNFKKMLSSDWSGGAAVVALDADKIEVIWQSNRMTQPYDKNCIDPRAVLGEEGFFHLEPFYPVHVPYYSPREFNSAFEFYLDKRFIQHSEVKTEQGQKEIEFLTNRNPGYLCDLTRAL